MRSKVKKQKVDDEEQKHLRLSTVSDDLSMDIIEDGTKATKASSSEHDEEI